MPYHGRGDCWWAPNARPEKRHFGKEFGKLWHTQRRARILAILRDTENARTATIADELGVSRETIRRDLLAMEGEGLLERVHGGAVTAVPGSEETFARRTSLHAAEKNEIARKAVGLLRPGMIVFVDAGTTTMAFARALRDGPEVKVITNSVDIAQTLRGRSLLLGGNLTSDVPATFGELTLSEIGRFIADMAILSPTAIHPRHGVMYYELHESEVARAMCEKSSRVAILADGSKLNRTSRVAMRDAGAVDWLITDGAADRAAIGALVDACGKIL